jgi:hypothetical protein
MTDDENALDVLVVAHCVLQKSALKQDYSTSGRF